MLTGLSIRDVVLIDALDLEFGPGLGVLTGETGAGKSILLDALGLALGMRADSGLVRAGAGAGGGQRRLRDRRRTIRRWRCSTRTGSACEPGEPLVIRRIVKADGGSRAFVNDQPVSAGLLRELGASLVEIHGQHDDRGLLNPRGHRALLDALRPDRHGRRRRGLAARWRAARGGARRGPRRGARPPRATANGSNMRSRSSAGSRPSRARRRASPRCAPSMQAGARLGDELGAIAALLAGIGGRAGPAAPGGAAARPDRRRASRCWPRRWRRSTAR